MEYTQGTMGPITLLHFHLGTGKLLTNLLRLLIIG